VREDVSVIWRRGGKERLFEHEKTKGGGVMLTEKLQREFKFQRRQRQQKKQRKEKTGKRQTKTAYNQRPNKTTRGEGEDGLPTQNSRQLLNALAYVEGWRGGEVEGGRGEGGGVYTKLTKAATTPITIEPRRARMNTNNKIKKEFGDAQSSDCQTRSLVSFSSHSCFRRTHEHAHAHTHRSREKKKT
jgi:hypothetical protein